jgi:hypothetical protein
VGEATEEPTEGRNTCGPSTNTIGFGTLSRNGSLGRRLRRVWYGYREKSVGSKSNISTLKLTIL